MLHPVGDLPAAVYWRRRALVLGLLACVLGGVPWLVTGLVRGSSAEAPRAAAAEVPVPALDRIAPSAAGVRLPTNPATANRAATTPAATIPSAGAAPAGPAAAAVTSTTAVVRCTDAMITVVVTPDAPTAPVGSEPTFTLVVTNVSGAPCARPLDKDLQEIVLLDAGGHRVWGSNDCIPETTSDTRLLAPGEVVGFPVTWSGLDSAPGCAAPRVRLAAGTYALRGRLDTAVSPDAPFTLV